MSAEKKITSYLKCGNAPDTLGARELCEVSSFGQVFGFAGRGFSLAAARATLKYSAANEQTTSGAQDTLRTWLAEFFSIYAFFCICYVI